MAKQILKGFTMLTLIIGLSFVSSVVSANGQSSTTRASAQIPFEFLVGDRSLPSGKYTVSTATRAGDVLMIKNADTNRAAVRLTNVMQPKGDKTQARLVFHRYGQRYFLSEVWMGRNSSGYQLLKSRQERSVERELAAVVSKSEFAQVAYERIEIAATLR